MNVGIITGVALVICAAVGAIGGPLWGVSLWLALGVASLVVYIKTWTDTPPHWFWPVIVVAWPLVWGGQ